MNHLIKISTFVLLTALTICPTSAFSEEEPVYCAAFLPCNADGEVLEEYRSGPCGEIYAEQCMRFAADFLRIELGQCESARIDQSRKVKKLRKRLRRARRNQAQ